jgi:PHP family Zn ribbon phosphoesterase
MPEIIEADLHIHTCLSPCGDLLFSPRAAVQAAVDRDLRMIAICDHNSAENVPAAIRAARGSDVRVIPGLEVTSSEEVHVITLFAQEERALRMQELVYEHLQPGENDPRLFGEQVVVNENDEVERFNERLLIGATSLSIDSIVRNAHDLGGLAIASHVDREMFGLIGVLGMIPANLALDAIEISKHGHPDEVHALDPGSERFPIIRSSDAHRADEVGSITTRLRIEEPTFEELRMALHGEEGRAVLGPRDDVE